MTRDTFEAFQDPERGRFGDNELRPEKAPRVNGASDLVDLDMILHNDNPAKKAIAVSYAADTPFDKWVWLPRSLIEVENLGVNNRGKRGVRITLPEYVAKEKGLV
jgi:hypothetical protein